MMPCPKMQEVIKAISEQFEVDFSVVGSRIRLDLPGFDCLVVSRTDWNKLCVAHYYETQGHMIPEPEVVLFTADGSDIEWIPIAITQTMTGYISYVVLEEDGKTINHCNVVGQEELAVFTEQWAQNLLNDDWLTNATVTEDDPLSRLVSELHGQFEPEDEIDTDSVVSAWEEPLVVKCDCIEADCATWMELTPDGILAIEDAEGSRISIMLPEWLDEVIRLGIRANQSL